MKKQFLCLVISSVFFSYSHAQDVIVRKNGSTVEGKVTEVGIDKITYKLGKDIQGPNFLIRKSEVKQIEFENGETVSMNPNQPKVKRTPTNNMDEAFGRNMLNFSPMKVLDSGPGIGINYERLLGKRQMFGLTLPVSMQFPDDFAFVSNAGSPNNSLIYFSPGLKVYPFGQKRVTYAVGPNLFTALGKVRDYRSTYDPVRGTYIGEESTRSNFRFGVLVNNYVNFQITQQFQIGLNAALGSRYIDRDKVNNGYYYNSVNVTGEFNFNLGFRF
ncbi:hypothetical protein DSL64_11475 [Dyadobacter luteus]|uniref:Outer membrane protein beta-barrel domain-containing protein n=1 Tax=Dyadobacter luteus TaxID=2259619 RepID=A0A3D8YBS4_9BACT|nr:hypothetical protein [Dyadobacter luteus]REA61579.1 hypothetical protein DSL64_11475 [Dyadobacter luteus]